MPFPPYLPSTGGISRTSYKSWDEQQLRLAFEAVERGSMSVRRAAEQYGVPRSTLHDRLSGKVQFGAVSGPPKYLSCQEEEELVNFLIGCSNIGYAHTKAQVLSLVQQVVTAKGLKVQVTHGWWDSFRRRHPNITLRTAELVSHSRGLSGHPEVLMRYFDLLEQTLKENDLLSEPSLIYNIDETGLPLDPKHPMVVAKKGQKHPVSRSTGDKAQVTVLSCCSASGNVLPPFVIFDRKRLTPELTRNEVPGTLYGLSSSGWIDSELFSLWFTHHFLPYAPSKRPILLLMDGHSSHFSPEVIRLAASDKIILFCLPPHSTHLTQPLDKGCFAPLKKCWRKACKDYLMKNPGKVVTRHQFSELFHRAWQDGMTAKNAVGGFKTTGIYPFNRSALCTVQSAACSGFDPASVARQNGLNFVPLYSPARSSCPRSLPLSYEHPLATDFEQPPPPLSSPIDMAPEQPYFLQNPNQLSSSLSPDQPSPMIHQLSPTMNSDQLLSSGQPSPPLSPGQPSPPLSPGQLSPPLILSPLLSPPPSPLLSSTLAAGLSHRTTFSKIVTLPKLVNEAPQLKKRCARVLTSSENLKLLEEKEKKKEKALKEKEQKRIDRERKKEERERKKQEKEKQRQERAGERQTIRKSRSSTLQCMNCLI